MSSASPVRGMRDFLPEEKARRERVLRAIRMAYTNHGFAEIETPHLESLTHLLSDQGGENEKMLFKVQKRGLTLDRAHEATTLDELCDIGLRYDLTVGLGRFYANNRGKIPEVFRSMNIGPVWRAERPQKGRYRQFTQCDIDIVGESTPLAEVELITTTIKALAGLGLTGLTLRINDRRLLTALLRDANAPESQWPRCLIIIDKLDKIELTGVTDELAEFLDPGTVRRLVNTVGLFSDPAADPTPADPTPADPAIGAPVMGTVKFAELVRQPEVPDLLNALDQIMAAVRRGLGAIPVSLRFDGSLVRGMGYYTGPIFELWHPEFRGAVAGGGRYDGMIGRITGTNVPACGFSIGFERIIDLVDPALGDEPDRVALVYDRAADWGALVCAQADLVSAGKAARLVPRPKRLAPLLDSLLAEGFSSWIEVRADNSLGEHRPLHRAFA